MSCCTDLSFLRKWESSAKHFILILACAGMTKNFLASHYFKRATMSHPDTESHEPLPPENAPTSEKAEEIGGNNKPEPTRYGDWEIAGKCVDF